MKPKDLKAEHHFVDLPRLRMHYVEKGQGPIVVLLHGFPESWWSWRHQFGPLVEAGFRVVAPDLRGYGDTDKHGPFDLDTLVRDVGHLIESLGGERKVRVVGHDWGGEVAWHLASFRADFCERLAVINCPHPAMMRRALLDEPSARQLVRSWYMFFFQLPLLPEWALTRRHAKAMVGLLRGNALDRSNFGPDELKPFRDAILRPGAATAMINWYREAMRGGFRERKHPRVYPVIDRDVLLLWGVNDRALGYNELVPGTKAWAPRLKIEGLEPAGHFVHSERPDLVNPLLVDFLKHAPTAAAATS